MGEYLFYFILILVGVIGLSCIFAFMRGFIKPVFKAIKDIYKEKYKRV